MNVKQVIEQRQSIRKYSDRPVEKEIIEQLLESARLAPSAVNYQPWKFLVCTSEKTKNAVRESYPRDWFNQAQLYIVACGNHNASWKRAADGKDHCDIDIAIAVEHIVLTATDLGIATCWVCNFDAKKLKTDLNLDENWEPIAILPLAYPASEIESDARSKHRKKMEEIAVWM